MVMSLTGRLLRDGNMRSSLVRLAGRRSSTLLCYPIIPTATKHVVTEAFNVACRNNDVKYTPHSSRHTLAAERDASPLTHEQRKAWSEAMGHETEQTTDVHYGRLSDERRTELFRQTDFQISKYLRQNP